MLITLGINARKKPRFFVIWDKFLALMIKYTSSKQLTLDNFKHPFNELNNNNRWIKLAELVPWDDLAGVYARNLNPGAGRLSVDVRMVIGALIIKHRMCLSDRDTVDMISENIYMQYFCGLPGFQQEKPFDPSLFVDIRKRMGKDKFDAFNRIIIEESERLKPARKKIITKNKSKETIPEKNNTLDTNGSEVTRKKGKLKIDASVADQYITYPSDLKLLNNSREEAERLIDALYKKGNFEKKPRTYRRNARKEYLLIAKKRRPKPQKIRVAIGKQLRYLSRDLNNIEKMLDHFGSRPFPLEYRDQKIYWVLQHIYNQQNMMYKDKTHNCPNRIVNIYQPYVRPIVRGKDRTNVEFGAKINISEVDGFVRLDHFSWDNYNEGLDLKMQVEAFRKVYHCYPEAVLADKIYLTRENRKWLNDNGIKITGKPLGRPPKETKTAYQRWKFKKECNKRNHVEGKFGQGKNGYRLNQIRAKRSDTSTSWVSAILFVMNLLQLTKLAGNFLCFLNLNIQRIIQRLFSSFVNKNRLLLNLNLRYC